jgi:hypothetical protein
MLFSLSRGQNSGLNTSCDAPLLNKYSDGLLCEGMPPYDCMNAAEPAANPPLAMAELMGMQGVSSILNGDLKSKLAITFFMKKLTGPWKHEKAMKHLGQFAFCFLSMRKLVSREFMYFRMVASVKLLGTNLSF